MTNECIKKSFSKNYADKFRKGPIMSRLSKKKSRIYLCGRCYNYHLTTEAKNKKSYELDTSERFDFEDDRETYGGRQSFI